MGGIVASDREVLPAPHTPTPGSWADNAITLAWLGHATVLINFYGVRVLTDPALFPRIGIDVWIRSIGPLRLMSSALLPSQLPEIDLVLVSHAHFDHLDTPSLAALPGRPGRRSHRLAIPGAGRSLARRALVEDMLDIA